MVPIECDKCRKPARFFARMTKDGCQYNYCAAHFAQRVAEVEFVKVETIESREALGKRKPAPPPHAVGPIIFGQPQMRDLWREIIDSLGPQRRFAAGVAEAKAAPRDGR